jgi:serralysin
LIHEIGHALGLLHPGDYEAGSADDPRPPTYEQDRGYMEDSQQYTVMSYFSEQETGADFNGAFAATPLLHDIAAVQRLYGANMNTRTGDTTYGYNSNADRAAFHISSPDENPVFAIWDAGGIDTLDFSGSTFRQTIRLSDDSFSSVNGLTNNVAIAAGVDIEKNAIENAKGGSNVDYIYGNGFANEISGNDGGDYLFGDDGEDTLNGDAGNDSLEGGWGRDTLRGGANEDTLDGGHDGELDTLEGGAGNDTYIVHAGCPGGC